ncbi:MAG: enzyme of heme biosynthesis [Alistipes sp.]|nr:enzyme of heme biosynthesis [Alistipes sp.]
MNRVKILLSAAMAFVATAATAQDFSDPRYAPWGDTPELRKENILTSNLLKEAVAARDYDAAAGYFRTLAEQAPTASEATFIRGAQVYSGKVQRAKTLEEKQVMLDSLMTIYDLRVQYFPHSRNYGKAYVLDRKAREYLLFNPGDREGVRRMYEEAIEAGMAGGYKDLKDVALIYFKNLCDDYAAGDIYPEEVLAQYERLAPVFDGEEAAVQESRKQFDACFASSGAANCENLEKLFRPRIEADPDNTDLLRQTVGLMSRSKCDSPYFLEIAERYYAVDPSAQTAMMLAQGFQEAGDYAKAATYLREAIGVEPDAGQKGALLVRLSMVELAAGHASAAASAAAEARSLNPENGRAYFCLAQAYAASAGSLQGLDAQAIFWVAYDTMAQAANLLADDPDYGGMARDAMANYRRGFPTAEECFFRELMEGARYTLGSGPAKGVSTTVRPR